MASTEIEGTDPSTIATPENNAVGIFDKLSQPCDGVGKVVWNGTSLSDAAHHLILLIRASRNPEVPAFVFFRPLVRRHRWTESGEIHTAGCELSSFAQLCLQLSELPTSTSKEPENGLTCPKDIFAWFCCSSYDINHDEDFTDLGDEFKRLLSTGAFIVHVKDSVVYLSLSKELRDNLLHVPIEVLREARSVLVGLVILSLAEPYAEPLWEMVSLHCRGIFKSTVIPHLLLAETRELNELSHMIEPAGQNHFNSTLMTLPFHLVNMGFCIDKIHWQALFGYISLSYNMIPEAMSTLFDEFGTASKLEEILVRTHWLQANSFLWSLIGFAIAQKRRHSVDLDFPWWYEQIPNKWLALGQPRTSTMGTLSRSLVFPETVHIEVLSDHIQPLTQASIGIALNSLGFPQHGCPLLDRFLKSIVSNASTAMRSTESVLYGLLSAELLNYENLSQKGEALLSKSLDLVHLRDNTQLGNRPDSIFLKLAVADTHVLLADYTSAKNLLEQVLLSGNLDRYTRIVTTLRLNKIGRRTGRFSGRFGDSLGMIVPLIAEADIEVQKEFVAELIATITHLKRVEPASPYHSDLGAVVRQTIDLYGQSTLLQDDWRLQMIREASANAPEGSSNLTPLHKNAIGQQDVYSSMSPPSTVSPEASFISSSAASRVITKDYDSHAETWYEQHDNRPSRETAIVSQEALTPVNNFLDQLLFYFLSSAQALTLSALRQAVTEVLNPKLAKYFVNYADERLREHIRDVDEKDYTQRRQGVNDSQEWDLELVWKLTRLRCMASSSLGDMKEEDENIYVEKLAISYDVQVQTIISPAAIIFMTSVIEYMGKLMLIAASQATYHGLHAKSHTNIKESSDTNIKESSDTNIKESSDTNIKESSDTNIKESSDTNIKESSDTNIKESSDTLTKVDEGSRGHRKAQGKKKRGFGSHQPFTKKLACLFFKLDPRKYQCCAGYKITEWDRLLQHLKRQHLIEGEHCPKCREEFCGEDAETEKNEHIQQDTCIEETALETGLLLEVEYEALTGLHGSHEEKWYKAWKKLFGEHTAPYSPFFETVDCMLEVHQSTMERELPNILQSFRRDTLARSEGDTTSATTDAILKLLRNPIPTSNSLIHDEAQAVLAPSAPTQIPWFPDIPPSHDSEPFRPSTGDVYDRPTIQTMEARPFGSQDMSNEVLWRQPLEEPDVFADVDEFPR